MKCSYCGNEMKELGYVHIGLAGAKDIAWCDKCGGVYKNGKMTLPKKQETRCTCWKCMGLDKDPYAEDEQKEVVVKIGKETALIDIIRQIYNNFECSVDGKWVQGDPIYFSSLFREEECVSEKVKRLLDFVSDDEGLTHEEVVGELEAEGIDVEAFKTRVKETVTDGLERNLDAMKNIDKKIDGKKLMDKHRQNLIEVLEESPRNWSEDFPHENGMYMCRCVKCREYFYGHKRRVVCKVCQTKLENEQ